MYTVINQKMNNNFSIIEDCSPYYVRFTHNNISEIIDIANAEISKVKFYNKFTHYRLKPDTIEKIIPLCPLYNNLKLSKTRLSAFVSQPGLYYRAHKDGLNHHFSINYTLQILDDKCVTSWYSDKDLTEYTIDNLQTNNSRECVGFDKRKHSPLKTMIAQPNECILFNTEIFHDWDNTTSSNQRAVLTLRLADYSQPDSFFNDAKETLLNMASNFEICKCDQ
jgi:hypothetical protein